MSDSAKAPDQVPEKVCKLIERAHQEWMAALDVVNDPIFLHDSEFRILRCNKAYQQCAGLAFEQIIGQPYYEIFPKTHAPLRHCLQAMERTAGELEEELTVDGAIYRSRSFTIWDDEGVYLYSIHTLEDITGRKQDEKRLRDSEAFIKAVLDNLPVGIAVNSSAPPVVFNYMNDNFPGLYRTTRDKLTDPDSFWEAVYEDPGFRQQIRQRVLEDCASGDVGRMHWDDIPLVRSGEETAYISARDIPLPDKQLVISMVWDVTERKRAEQVLQDEKRFSDALVQKLPDIFFLLDPQGKLLRWNMNLQEASGLSAEEVAAANALDFVHEEDRPLIVQKIRQTLETGSASAEARLVLKNRDRDYVLTGTRIETQHGPNVIGLGVDISERKQHELAMKRANRALRTISAGNEALIHATEEGALLQEMCDVAVQVGGYRMAWIGYSSDDAGKTIEQMAQAGFEEISPNLSPLQWNDALRESCPAGRAIISGRTEVVQDVLTDAEGSGWRESARRYGYASCIALPLMDGKRAFGALVLFDDKVNVFDADELKLLEEMSGDLAFGILTLRVKAAHREHEQRLQKNMLQTVEAIASIVEMRDPYTSGHQARVAVLAQEIARQMGLPEEQMHAIHLAGLVHDLGKIQVPAEILSKPGRLTELEYSMIKMHPRAGYDILKGVDFSWPIAEMVWQHHERMDGSGYPRGLKGEEILPAARILSVADLVEAMSSHRPYRAGLGIDAALAEISRGRGTLFDAQVVDACVALFREHNYVLPN